MSICTSGRERVGVVTFLLDTHGSPVTIGNVGLVQPGA